MSRLISVVAIVLGWGFLLGEMPLQAQQLFRTQQLKAPQQGAAPVIVNQGAANANNNAAGFNVIGGNQGNALPNNAAGNNANAIINGLNNGSINSGGLGQFTNPYTAMLGNSPYANVALDPTNYNMMNYGNPYGIPPGTPINPFYNPLFNPYPFLPPGPMGMNGQQQRIPTPGQIYNFNYNFAYLSNPYLNPLSNPAFSGPFPAGAFNAGTALNLMGAGNILQNFPLPAPNFNSPGAGNNNNNPFP